MLEEIGLFDEGFGLIYFEDAEMSWRAYRRGWKAHYVPLSVVYHKGRASLGMNKEVRDNFQEHLDRNFIKMVKLHATSSQKAWATLLWMKEAFMQGAVSLFSGKTEGPDYKRRLVLLWSR